MKRLDLKDPSDCGKYLKMLQCGFQRQLGQDHKLYWIIDGREKLIEDLNQEELLAIAFELASKLPCTGGTQ